MASQLELAERRARIQELEAKGVRSPAKLAEALGVSLRTIHADLEALDLAQQKTDAAVELRARHRRRLIAQAEWRQDQLAAEWERSKKDRERSKLQETTGAGEEGGKTVQERVQEGRIAECALLREHRENGAEIAKLVGAYPAAKNLNLNLDLASLTDEELEHAERIARKLAGA